MLESFLKYKNQKDSRFILNRKKKKEFSKRYNIDALSVVRED